MKLFYTVTAFVLISKGVFCEYWVAMDPSKSLPANAVVGGQESWTDSYNGPLYIGRKQFGNELVIGKVIDSWKSGYFPKDGGEHWSDHYQVLTMTDFVWDKGGDNFSVAVAGGNAGDGEAFYVCQGKLNGQVIPGKYYKPTGCCYVASFGKEHCVTDFSLLVDEKRWREAMKKFLPLFGLPNIIP